MTCGVVDPAADHKGTDAFSAINGRHCSIGEAILNIAAAQAEGLYTELGHVAASACRNSTLDPLMTLSMTHWSALCAQTSRLLRSDTDEGQRAQAIAERILVPMVEAELVKPGQEVGDFTDFLTSVYHATNGGMAGAS